jgi:nucleoside triphosphate diphosphatase
MMSDFTQLQRLIDIMAQLRDPDNGCPWDLEQNLKSLIPYTIEETYELAEAIEKEDTIDTVKELGDLLFHLVFYAQLGKEQELFDFEKIAQLVSDKMIFRHPHVFSDHEYGSREEFEKDWIKRKQEEIALSSKQKYNKAMPQSLMENVSTSLPAMTRAVKLQKQAAHIGFDWDNKTDVLNKLKEEIRELEQVLNEDQVNDINRVKDELGDIFFSCINLSRHLQLEPETVLRHANKKFSERFRKMESQFQYDHDEMERCQIDDLEKIWKNNK